MGSEWVTVSIDDIKAKTDGAIAIGPFGSRMKSDSYVESGIPVIRGTNITGGPTFEGEFVYITPKKANTLGSSNVYKDDLVFPHRGSIGEVGIVLDSTRYVISSSLMKLTCDTAKVYPKFIYYFFKSSIGKHELLKNSSQVGTPGIGQPLTSLKAITLKLPPLSEQKAIAHILGSLDDKIELNRQMNATLEAMAQALFKSWFVDFDPVIDNALAAGNPIPDELQSKAAARLALGDARKSLPIEIQALFPSSFVLTEEMGWIPEGWEVGTLENHCEIIMGQSPKGETYNTEKVGTPLVNGPVEFGDYFTEEIKWTTEPTKLSKTNDLIICVRGSTTGRFVKSNGIYCLGRGVSALRGKESQIFIEQLYKNSLVDFLRYTTGSTFPSWNAPMLKSFRVIAPPINTIKKFDSILSAASETQNRLHYENNTLSELRDTLLPKLLSGELRIPE